MTTRHSAFAKMVSMLRLFRLQSNEMPMQQADILITIASRPGISMGELADEVGLAQSSVSRNVAGLAAYAKPGMPGLALVEALPDPQDSRRRRLFLTAKGKAFVQQLMGYLDPDFNLGEDTATRLRYAAPTGGDSPSPRKAPGKVVVPLAPRK